jgi:NADP oxidoreductase coenzyme F420-dependent
VAVQASGRPAPNRLTMRWSKCSKYWTVSIVDSYSTAREVPLLCCYAKQYQLMPELTKRIAILGAGNMGSALIGGILKAGVTNREHLVATTKSLEHAEQVARRFSISVTAGRNREAVERSDVVILAVKPSRVASLLEEAREAFRAD